MASYEERNGKYRVVISVMDKGVRRKVSKTFEKKKDATAWATTMESDKFQNKKIIASSMLFPDYFEMWIKNYKANDIRESTLASYNTAAKNVRDLFPNTKLSDLNYPLLQRKLDSLGIDHKRSSLNVLVAKIKASLKDALYDGYITSDFFSRLKPHGLAGDDKLNALSVQEFELLQAYLYAHQDEERDLALLIGLETGMRIGEVLGLNYSDVSKPFNNIHIDKSLAYNLNVITPPKNKNAYRDVKITDKLTNLILSNESSGRIFSIRASHVRDRLIKIIKILGITPITVHGLRHSHASYLLYKGVSINYVSKRLGHANTAITQKVYAHMLEEERISEAEKTLSILSMSPEVPKTLNKRGV